MTRFRIALTASIVLSVTAWAAACGDATVEPPPDPPRPTTVVVSPPTAELTALGATVQLTAEVRDQNGQIMSGAAVTWASSDASVATVAASGMVTAAGNGAATVMATSGAATGSAAVTVAQVVAEVAVTPAIDTVFTGGTLQLAASAADANGHAVADASFAWASGDTSVARVDDSGLATGVAVGTTAITASSGGVTGAAQLTVVAPVPTDLAVTPDSVKLAALGDTVRLVAQVLDESGRVIPGAEVGWSSANATVATVDAAGLVTAIGNGAATVMATSGAATGSAAVTVAQVVAQVAVTPAADTVFTGDTLRLAASAADANGHAVADASFAWASGDSSVARVDDSGLATGVAAGATAITASSRGVTGAAQLTVVAPPTPSPDRAALVAFYEATGGPNWDESDNWLSDRPVGEWHGVQVNDEKRVISLRLTSNNLVGAIPAAVGRLSEIEEIRLAFNRLSGTMPAELGSLPQLRVLRLDSNNLSGAIPAELGALSELVELALSQNSLSGQIPRELGELSRLEYLSLRWNNLRGPIPPELSQLSLLRLLNLGTNAITGSIPPELGELANLERLDLGINELTGAIPGQLFARTTRLQSLWLGYNRLTGPLPPEIGNLSQLEHLSLHRTDLTGPLPAELGNLRRLKLLRAYQARITGPLPPELGQLTGLEELYLYDNDITGPIPAEWGGMSSLQTLLLFGNRLIGPLPPELGDLEALQWLWLSGNDLEGGVPGRFANMTALTQLDVTDNPRMSGPLPATLTQLDRLEALLAGGTELCAPGGEPFTSWLGRIWKQRVAVCGGSIESAFLLTQAIQSRSFPVPLVADEAALLRVFVTAADGGGATIPPVRASFYWGAMRSMSPTFPGSPGPSQPRSSRVTWPCRPTPRFPGACCSRTRRS